MLRTLPVENKRTSPPKTKIISDTIESQKEEDVHYTISLIYQTLTSHIQVLTIFLAISSVEKKQNIAAEIQTYIRYTREPKGGRLLYYPPA